MTWQPIETAPYNTTVMTKIHDGEGERNVQVLKKVGTLVGSLWFVPDESEYVWDKPTHWMPLPVLPGVEH
jgi:hypothetical protein